MKPEEALVELLDRVGANQGAAVLVNDDELHQWPREAVEALQSQRLIVRARPASSAVCPGCEQACVMPVHTVRSEKNNTASFIVCDKRSDINRVPVSSRRMIQWQCNTDLVCGFIAAILGLRRSDRQTANADLWEIGMATGNKRIQMLCLQANGELALVAGNSRIPLVEFIGFTDGAYVLDVTQIRRMADSSTTADDRYTPNNSRREDRKLKTQVMYENWQKTYRALKKRSPGMSDVWYSLQIAKMDIAQSCSAETIRKKMKK
jgi:hypothetical protein